jgi:hypothetical protein
MTSLILQPCSKRASEGRDIAFPRLKLGRGGGKGGMRYACTSLLENIELKYKTLLKGGGLNISPGTREG